MAAKKTPVTGVTASGPLATKLKALAKIMADLEVLDAKRKPLADKEAALREELLRDFSKNDLNGATAAGLRVSLTTAKVPSMEDRDAFLAFASKKANWDLLAGSVNSAAWRERLEAGKVVPGVTVFDRVGIRVNKV